MLRFSRPRLITFDDPAYRAHVEEMLLQRANQRALQPPSQRDLFGGEAEEVIRAALGKRWSLSPRRILDYNERRGQHWYRKFRELDAVVEGERRVHIVEIKASRTARALHRAMAQLRDSSDILRLLFRTVATTLVFVDTGTITAAERDAFMLQADAPEQPPQTLAEAIAAYPSMRQVPTLADLGAFPQAPELVVLHGDDVVALAGERPLSLQWDEEQDANDERLLLAPSEGNIPLYTSGAVDDENASSFAAALQKAVQRSNKRR